MYKKHKNLTLRLREMKSKTNDHNRESWLRRAKSSKQDQSNHRACSMSIGKTQTIHNLSQTHKLQVSAARRQRLSSLTISTLTSFLWRAPSTSTSTRSATRQKTVSRPSRCTRKTCRKSAAMCDIRSSWPTYRCPSWTDSNASRTYLRYRSV